MSLKVDAADGQNHDALQDARADEINKGERDEPSQSGRGSTSDDALSGGATPVLIWKQTVEHAKFHKAPELCDRDTIPIPHPSGQHAGTSTRHVPFHQCCQSQTSPAEGPAP